MQNYATLLVDKTSQQLQDLIAELRAKNFALEAELCQAKQLAEQANVIKTEFMRNMEHDIRTPFNGVLALTNCLRDIEEDVTKKEYLSNIAESAQELLDYCNSILDFSKIEAGMLAVVNKNNLFCCSCNKLKLQK